MDGDRNLVTGYDVKGAATVLAFGTLMGAVLKGSTPWRGLAFSSVFFLSPVVLDKIYVITVARLYASENANDNIEQQQVQAQHRVEEPFFTKRRVFLLLGSAAGAYRFFKCPGWMTMLFTVVPFTLFVQKAVINFKQNKDLKEIFDNLHPYFIGVQRTLANWQLMPPPPVTFEVVSSSSQPGTDFPSGLTTYNQPPE